ncbi:MAG: hypothetical protein Q8P20_10980 [bacterium]|nr:hypothetical protein [bacterium]
MIGVINLFLPLFVQVLILYALSRLLDRVVLRQLGKGWYLATMWPGVMVHELSHALGCLLTFTKIYKINLFKLEGDTLGSVEHAHIKNPLTKIIISTAPLFGVTAAMWGLTILFFPDLYKVHIEGVGIALENFSTFQNFFNFTASYFTQYWDFLKELVVNLNFSEWQTYVFLYLMLTLSSHAAPSKKDLNYTVSGIFVLAIVFLALYYFDQWIQVPLTWSVIKFLTWPIYLVANFLIYGIAFSAVSLVIMQGIGLILRAFKRGS